jgi:hypothetical protein
MEAQTQVKKCVYLPEKDCPGDMGGCMNFCPSVRGSKLYPMFMSNEHGTFKFNSAEEYEKFIKECKHEHTHVMRGCDGCFVLEQVICDRCDLIISAKGEQVWGDACV